MNNNEYLTQSDWEFGLPDWLNPELMMKENIILPPERVMKIPRRAKEFLMKADGTNKGFRIAHAPAWFDNWWGILGPAQALREWERRGDFVVHPGMVGWEKLGMEIRKVNAEGRKTGLASMAGGEGHPGHLFFLNKMREQIGWRGRLVLALEQDGYLVVKDRGAPFLPLPVRLSMWLYAGFDYVTLMPEKPRDITGSQVESFYMTRFRESGCRYSFATIGEPADEIALAKSQRGESDIKTLLPKLETPSTSQLVQRLMDSSQPVVEWGEGDMVTVI